ncbi:MAG: hypothetical protein P8K73_02595 [Methylophilaceae bacterium]|nr:hypothetical protein [Methylophilaceae bacterium]
MKYFIAIQLILFSVNCLAEFNNPQNSLSHKSFEQLAFYSNQPNRDYRDEMTTDVIFSCEGIEEKNIIEHDIEYGEHTHKTKLLGIDMEYISLVKDLTSFLLLGIK